VLVNGPITAIAAVLPSNVLNLKYVAASAQAINLANGAALAIPRLVASEQQLKLY
jgi:hypothetical protein